MSLEELVMFREQTILKTRSAIARRVLFFVGIWILIIAFLVLLLILSISGLFSWGSMIWPIFALIYFIMFIIFLLACCIPAIIISALLVFLIRKKSEVLITNRHVYILQNNKNCYILPLNSLIIIHGESLNARAPRISNINLWSPHFYGTMVLYTIPNPKTVCDCLKGNK